MAQFDVHRLDDVLLVVDLQPDLIGLDMIWLVAPLHDPDRHVAFSDRTLGGRCVANAMLSSGPSTS